jgi:digeranylgeranylglycerophospholipid reductase
MKPKKYDVIIIGAGVSGLMLVELLKNSKLKVLLIEKREDIRKPKNHQFGTFIETVKKFKLEKYVIKYFTKFGFHSPNHQADFNYNKKQFAVVDIELMAKDLKYNCDLLTGTELSKIQRENNKIKLKIKNTTYNAKIIVDCSGDKKIVAKSFGLDKDTLDMYDKAYLLDNCNLPYLDKWLFITDARYANEGFWYYPLTKKMGIFGFTDFVSKKMPLVKNQIKSIDYYIRDIAPYKEWFKNAKIKETLIKPGPTTQLLDKIYGDNFLLCGDASGGGTPLVGEGYRIAVEMAFSASEVIQEAFKKNDFTEKTLKTHYSNFYEMFGKYYIWSNILRFLSINFFTNREWDIFGKNLKNNLSNKELLIALKSEINFKIFLKCLSPGLLFNMLLNSFKYTFNGFKPINKRVLK